MNNLQRLTKLLRGKTCIKEQPLGQDGISKGLKSRRAVRTLDGTIATRTHNIQMSGKSLWWENNRSQQWGYSFSDEKEAIDWWDENVKYK